MSKILPTLILLALIPRCVSSQQSSVSASPTPVFIDTERRAMLATAFDAIRESMPAAAQQIGAPGLAWGVVIDGELAASGAVGLRDVESKAAATDASVFRIASMSKSFTALAILKLRDAGKLSLDDAVAKHIPEFARVKLPTTDAPPITIRHLLTHSEGFPEDNPWGDRQLAIPEATLSEWLTKGLPFSTSPGTAFEYSNYGFALLGRVVTNVSGRPYGDYIRAEILKPLGMASTYWDTRDVPADRLAHGYRRDGDGWIREVPLAHGSFGAMGGLYTSAQDLARYVAFMLSAWPSRDEPDPGPVRRSSVREMQQGQRQSGFVATRSAPDAPLNARTSAYAYGLGASQDCRFRFSVSHGGGLPGFGSNMLWLPEYGVGVIVLANVTYAGAGGIARTMLEKLAATGALQPRRLPASAPLLATRTAVVDLVNQWDDARLQAMAADNLLLDRPLARRREEVARLHETLGACAPTGDIDVENWLRGSFRLNCERGWLTVSFTLAPTQPPRVQFLFFSEGRPLSDRVAAVVRTLAAATAADSQGVSEALGPTIDMAAINRQLAAVRGDYGACTIGDTLSGDGATRARVRLTCERGRADITIRSTASGQVEQVQFGLASGDACVP